MNRITLSSVFRGPDHFRGASLALLLILPAAAALSSLRAEIAVDASFNDVTVDDSGDSKNIRTGQESRTQLSGERGTIRVGANSRVGVRRADETLDLQQGVMMVKTGRKGLLGRQSLSVETEQIRATTNATMLISYQPRRYIKIACLEGKVTVSLKGIARETVTIRKGQLLIINCLENVLPDAVSVDMNRLMQTSPLLAPALHGRPAGGPPRQPGSGNPPPPGNNAGNGPPPPPENQARAERAARAAPQARGFRPAQPRANDLAVRQIDCRITPNAAECRRSIPGRANQPLSPQQIRQQQQSQMRASQRRGSSPGNSQPGGTQAPPPPPPPPPKPPKPKPPPPGP